MCACESAGRDFQKVQTGGDHRVRDFDKYGKGEMKLRVPSNHPMVRVFITISIQGYPCYISHQNVVFRGTEVGLVYKKLQ